MRRSLALCGALLLSGVMVSFLILGKLTETITGRCNCPTVAQRVHDAGAAQFEKYTFINDSVQIYMGRAELAVAAPPIPRSLDSPPLPPWAYGRRQLRATHYFSIGNPLDFWERVELSRIDKELQMIQLDGFDAIILAVPWPGFQISSEPPLYDPFLYRRLHDVMAAARRQGLYVITRVGYAYNYNPDNRIGDHCMLVLKETGRAMAAWVDYLGSLQEVYSHYDNYLLSFNSWEDNMCVLTVMALSVEERSEIARMSGFQDWLKERGIAGASNACVPTNDGSDPEGVRQWRDFYQTIWKRVLLEGRKAMPGLTMEVRIDEDPIFRSDKSIDPYKNDYLANELGPEVPRAIYYASFWAMPNVNQSVPADTALANLEYLLKSTGEHANTSLLFVNQFNFVDNTPDFVGIHDYITPNEVPQFLRGAARLFKRHSMGYGLWSLRAYRQSDLYNPSFEKGFHGWGVEGEGARIVRGPAGDAAALLDAVVGPLNLSLTTIMHSAMACDGRSMGYKVCATYHLLRGGPHLTVQLGGQSQFIELRLGDAPAEICIPFMLQDWVPKLSLSFSVPQGTTVVLDNVDVFCHVQTLKVYDDVGAPDRYLSAIRELNYALGQDGAL